MALEIIEEAAPKRIEVNIDANVVKFNIRKLTNQIYRLLPANEEGKDWKKPLETCLIELTGMGYLFPDQSMYLSLTSKLCGIMEMEELSFQAFRRTIFECCGILNKIEKEL